MSIRDDVTPVVLMGGPSNEDLLEATGAGHTCNLVVAGQTLAERALEAVRDSYFRHKPIVVGRRPITKMDYTYIKDQGGLWPNVHAALKAAKTKRIMTVTTDMPLLDADKLREFVAAVDRAEQKAKKPFHFCYSVSLVTECDKIMPGMTHTSMTFKEGETFSAGNVMVMHKRLTRVSGLAGKITLARKEKKALSKTILLYPLLHAYRLPFALRHLKVVLAARKLEERTKIENGKPVTRMVPTATKAIPFANVARMVSDITGVRCGVVRVPPQLACDIDNLEQWQLFARLYESMVEH